jgi:hypothetical protein
METRPYFLFGDLVANVLAGAMVALLCSVVFGPSWNMIMAMFVGMALGMILSMFVALPMGALFGAMEVMVPVMTTGMVAGMVVSMGAAMEAIPAGRAVLMGVWSGVGTLIACSVANAWMKGRAKRWTS